jgi:predicted O-methyltransferase YrrM
MNFEEAARIVEGIPAPHTSASRGRVLYEHIRERRPENLLELGTARGGSAVFIAAALEANGAGHLTSVDSTRWQWLDPTPREVLDKAGLSSWVTLDKRFSTYTWFLKAEIEKRLDAAGSARPGYDFIFLDGCKNWRTDGLAVVLAEKLIRPGGWLLLDDLGWNYEKHCETPTHYEIEIAKLSYEERTQPHLRATFDLLIRTNPAFDQFVIQNHWWGWARKAPHVSRRTRGGVLSRRNDARGTRARLRQISRRVWLHR